MYGKLEKQSLWPFWYRPRILLVRLSLSASEVFGLLRHGIVVNMAHHLPPVLAQQSRHKDFARPNRPEKEKL